MVLGIFVAGLAGLAYTAVTDPLFVDSVVEGTTEDEMMAPVMVIGVAGSQLAMAAWPWIVLAWKGRSRRDFGFEFRWGDVGLGVGVGVLLPLLSGMVAVFISALLGIDPSEASNTAILVSFRNLPWRVALVALIVVGAPLSEEFFFRGLVLRALQKRFGAAWALVGTTVAFALVHIQASPPAELVVLLASIGAIGAVLGVLALRTGRITAPIVAHMVTNGIVVTLALYASSLE